MILILPVCAFLVDYSLAFSEDKWGVKEFGKCPPDDTRFRIFLKTSAEDCVKQCAKRRVCKVIGYKRSLKMCELHTESVNATDEIHDKHCVQIKMDTVNISQITDGCSCPDWQVCDIIGKTCSYEECDPYESMQQLTHGSGVVYGNMNAKGSKKRLRCNLNFHNEKDEDLTECLATGQWSSTFECKANTNVAVGKPAKQSSYAEEGYASYGVDGNTNQQYHFGSCFHTQEEIDPWWRVDLKSLFYVTKFVLYNREDSCDHCKSRAHHIEVKFGQTLGTLTLIDFISDVLPPIYRKQLGYEALTRYAQVSIKSTGTENGDIFHLCEVELYGYAA